MHNVTIPHTSPEITYTNLDAAGNMGWYSDCPQRICDDGSGNIRGSHFSNVTDASIELKFHGRAIYLYGDIDPGVTVTLLLNNMQENPITLSPNNGVLAAIDDWTTLCNNNSSCQAYADSPDNYSCLKAIATQSGAGAKFRFVKAVFEYPTDHSESTIGSRPYISPTSVVQDFTDGPSSSSVPDVRSEGSNNGPSKVVISIPIPVAILFIAIGLGVLVAIFVRLARACQTRNEFTDAEKAADLHFAQRSLQRQTKEMS